MIYKQCDSYWVKIYIAGPIEVAKQIIRREAKAQGMCVTIEPTTYVYTGGEEVGYVVGFINYPRFPASPDDIWARADKLAETLKQETYQSSYTIMDPNKSFFVTDRKE